MKFKHVASTLKYKGEIQDAIQWLNNLPRKYPAWRLKGIEVGDMVIWTTETGLKIWKKYV